MSMSHSRVACHLQAQTPSGPIRLGCGLPGAHGHMDNIDIALALARCEPLLLELEGWLACELDLLPIDSGTPPPSGLEAMVKTSAARHPDGSPERDEDRHGHDIGDGWLAPAGTRCHLPWTALLNLPAPPRLLGSQLTWPSLPCEMEIARYARPPAKKDAGQAGGLMLLPLSFEAGWPVRLTHRDSDVHLHCDWQANSGRLKHAGPARLGASDATDEPPAWRVLLRDLVDVPSDWLLGWREEPLSVEAAGATARMNSPDGPVSWAEGPIVPALGGSALLVDRQPASHA